MITTSQLSILVLALGIAFLVIMALYVKQERDRKQLEERLSNLEHAHMKLRREIAEEGGRQ